MTRLMIVNGFLKEFINLLHQPKLSPKMPFNCVISAFLPIFLSLIFLAQNRTQKIIESTIKPTK